MVHKDTMTAVLQPVESVGIASGTFGVSQLGGSCHVPTDLPEYLVQLPADLP